MTEEHKEQELLLKDLCTRLPYRVKLHAKYIDTDIEVEKGYLSAVEKAIKWLEENTDWSFEYDEVGRNFDFGKLEEFKEYMKKNIV